MGAPIGFWNFHVGRKNKLLNGLMSERKKPKPGTPQPKMPSPAVSSKRSFAEVVKTHAYSHDKSFFPSARSSVHVSKPRVFKRISFPDDYRRNYFLDPDFKRHNARRSFWVPKISQGHKTPKASSLEQISAPLSDSYSKSLKGPLAGVDPTAQHCSRCLGFDHTRKACQSRFRCNVCFRYGHSSRNCLSKARLRRIYRPVSKVEGERSELSIFKASPTPHRDRTPPALLHHSTVEIPSSLFPMAIFAVDPRPHLPAGYELLPQPLRPPHRHEVFVAGCYSLANEDLAIVMLEPPVHKDDFSLLAAELRIFFRDMH